MNSKNTEDKRLQQQYEGFLNTKNLWVGGLDNDTFSDIVQFEMPTINTILYTSEEIPDTMYLGKRAEYFLDDLLSKSERYEVLAKNIQVVKDKQTIGELDFIIYDNQNKQTIHLEQVYKFYTYDPSQSIEFERWIGPNRKDSFQQKLEKLQQHQLPLLYHYTTQEILKDLGISTDNIVQQVCYMAHCFIPEDFNTSKKLQINAKAISGTYLNFETFLNQEHSDTLYYIPQKRDWHINPSKCASWYTFKTIKLQLLEFQKDLRSPLLWIKTKENFKRCFVVWW